MKIEKEVTIFNEKINTLYKMFLLIISNRFEELKIIRK